MKNTTFLIIMVMLLSSTLFGGEMPFLNDYFYPRSIIVAFTQDAIGNRYGEIIFTRNEGIVDTHIERFNRLSEEYRIVDLVQMHNSVKHLDWHDNGIYIQNIYRVVLESNDNIEEAQSALAKNKEIIFAEYESINRSLYTPNDPDFHLQWHHPVIQVPSAWYYERGSSEIVIAITDSGTKWNHPDLADNIWINEAELPGITIDWQNGMIYGGDGNDNSGSGKIDDIMGWDFVENNNNPYQNYPTNGHGTHVAGCAGAVGDNNIGITGTAMNVSLLICKGAPSNHHGGGTIQYAYDQILYAAQAGAHIINASWIGQGNGIYPNTVVNHATSLGSLVIAGAGNSNVEHTPSYGWFPSDATNSLSVAGTDQNDIKAGFSDYGEPIDITAPGVSIRSTVINDGYDTSSGTSMSSPVAAGVAALVKSLHPNMSPLELKNRLMYTADCIDDINPGYAGLLGAGRINAFRASMYDVIPNLSIFNISLQEYSGDGDGIANPGEEINLFISIYNEVFWLFASNVTATLSSENQDVEILLDEVSYPDIEGGSIVFNTHQPFRFLTPATLIDLSLDFTLTITANQSSDIPFEKDFPFTLDLSLQQAGWPLELPGPSTSSPALWDLDGNGDKEIIFGDSQGNLRVVRKDRTSLPGFPVNLGSNISSAVAVGDLDNNNSAEIVANSQAGLITALDTGGNIIFQYDAGGQLRSNPMLIDVNNNGNLEIVALTFSNPRLIILNYDGTDFPGFPVVIDGPVVASPASADLNGDGYKEIIFSTSTGFLHAFSTLTGATIAGWPNSIESASWNGPLVADITSDSQPDIVIANIQGTVYSFDRYGNEIFSRTTSSNIRAGVVVQDLNSDGNNEIIFADFSGNLQILDNTGADWGVFPINVGAAIESTPVLADMNNDGNLDVIFGDNAGYLHSINISGNETPNFPISLGSNIPVSAAIDFVDTDNIGPDILVSSGNGLNFIDYKNPAGVIGWGFFKGNIRRSGNSYDMTSVEEIPEDLVIVTELHGNYPNPFNPDTRISFALSQESNVQITIYNVRGQKVKDLLNDRMESGRHNIVWNGTDTRGRTVGSGLYFYTLQTGEYRATRKMMMLK